MRLHLTARERFLLKMEINQFFVHRRRLHFVPLIMLGVFLTVWIYQVGSPFAPVVIVVVATCEQQFNNIFFRTPRELETMSLLPMPWQSVILVKNLATIVLVLIVSVITTMVLLYFSPQQISFDMFLEAVNYFSTVIFPLLCIGNGLSVNRPRRVSGLQLDDLIELIWIIINLAIISVPAYVFIGILRLPVLCPIYAATTLLYWYRRSLRHTSERITNEQITICSSL